MSEQTPMPTARIPLPQHVERPEWTRVESLVLVNTGDSKGKSSAAFGVMGRGWARGWRVGVVQFMKGGTWQAGERKLADTVTDMRVAKHAYQRGIRARKGIEY